MADDHAWVRDQTATSLAGIEKAPLNTHGWSRFARRAT
jgi:hypothetical protein